MTILQDIKTAVKMTGEIRKARREGAHIEARKVWTVPMLNTTYWPWTMEACLMCGGAAEKAVIDVFYALPVETQHSLTFTPKEPRGWVERAQFWAEELRPALPSGMYHKVMVLFIGWYARCLRMRKEATA